MDIENRLIEGRKTYHLSIDDCILIFRELAESKPRSIFQDPSINFLKNMHNEYDAKFSLYLFYMHEAFSIDPLKRNVLFTLDKLTDIYKDEFIENSNWLKLGFHGEKYDVSYNTSKKIMEEDFDQLTGEIKRFVGEECLTDKIRIHWYTCSLPAAEALKEREIKVLFAPDRKELPYYLSPSQSDLVNRFGYYKDEKLGLLFVKTDVRYEAENLENMQSFLEDLEIRKKFITLFTHEKFLDTDIVQERIKQSLKWLTNKEYEPVY